METRMTGEPVAGVQVPPSAELIRVPAWTVGLSLAVGAINGVALWLIVLADRVGLADSGEPLEAFLLPFSWGLPLAGSSLGLMLSPIGLLSAGLAVAWVRRGRSVTQAQSAVTAVVTAIVITIWVGFGLEWASKGSARWWTVMGLAAILGTAASSTLTWTSARRVLNRSAPRPND